MSIDLSLQRITKLLANLEPYTRPTIHIAGTNGKGSVSALLTQILLSAGLSVGRFNSPHLIDINDSITLNNIPISTSTYTSTYSKVKSVDKELDIGTSNFELLTATALRVFEDHKVDVVVCEVGLGGRLDATNAISDEVILVSVITAIDLDHTAFLGSTVEAIAREKAGIVRKGKTVVLSSQSHEGVEGVVREICEERGSKLVSAETAVEREWDEVVDGSRPPSFSINPFNPPPARPTKLTIEGEKYDVLLPLHGEHQLVNLGAALTVIHELKKLKDDLNASYPDTHFKVISSIQNLSSQDLRSAILNCTWAGRLSFHSYPPSIVSNTGAYSQPIILADGAHNEAAAIKLSSYISSLISSLSSSKTSTNAKPRNLSLTFVISLSHSPPKTPESVLLPLLSPFCTTSESSLRASLKKSGVYNKVLTRIALMGFSPPEGMPWVRNVPPSQAAEILRKSFPTSSYDARSRANTSQNDEEEITELWISPDEEPENVPVELNRVLKWAAGKGGKNDDSLVVVAGSLYLVADLYRILNR